jgi:hypothetical protein
MWHLADRVERRLRLGHHEVGLVPVDEQHGPVHFGSESVAGNGEAGAFGFGG